MPHLSLQQQYAVFYYTWLVALLCGLEHCDLILDMNRLGESPSYRQAIEGQLEALHIPADLSDCRMPAGHEGPLSTDAMLAVEEWTEQLLRDALPEWVAKVLQKAEASWSTLSPRVQDRLKKLLSPSAAAKRAWTCRIPDAHGAWAALAKLQGDFEGLQRAHHDLLNAQHQRLWKDPRLVHRWLRAVRPKAKKWLKRAIEARHS